jgi:hypothetical protein
MVGGRNRAYRRYKTRLLAGLIIRWAELVEGVLRGMVSSKTTGASFIRKLLWHY